MKPYVDDGDFQLYVGDVRDVLKQLPAESVHCVVTSPPYWGLRDYGTGEWEGGDAECDHDARQRRRNAGSQPGTGNAGVVLRDGVPPSSCPCGATRVDLQLGLESTPEEYVANMVEVFREVRRVLRADGTCWLNLGSSYFNGESYPLREIDAAWLAAVIDGEGCIQIHQQRRPPETNCVDSFQVDLGVGMMTPEVVQRCHEITGLGSCKQQARGVWDWSCRGQQAAQLLRAIYPYLVGKKNQAALAIMLADDLAARKYGRGNPAQPEVMEWRAQIRKAVSDCNQRLGTDFPIVQPRPITLGLKAKDDVGIPHRVAFALRDDGWFLRSDVVWSKPNPMPESVTDRPTKAHEYVFLLTKSPRYFFDQEAVRERYGDPGREWWTEPRTAPGNPDRNDGGGVQGRPARGPDGRSVTKVAGGDGSIQHRDGERWPNGGRNIRSVWEIATQPYAEAHFATYPEALVERCLKAGTSERGCCPECGAPWVREVERQADTWNPKAGEAAVAATGGAINGGTAKSTLGGYTAAVSRTSRGWKPSCAHVTYPEGGLPHGEHPHDYGYGDTPKSAHCVVLDPFLGSGTTALVARRLGRKCVGIELSPEYAELTAKRLGQLSLLAEGAA